MSAKIRVFLPSSRLHSGSSEHATAKFFCLKLPPERRWARSENALFPARRDNSYCAQYRICLFGILAVINLFAVTSWGQSPPIYPITVTDADSRRIGAAYDPRIPHQSEFRPVFKEAAIKKLPPLSQNTIRAFQTVTVGSEEQFAKQQSSIQAKASYGLAKLEAGLGVSGESGNASRTVTLEMNIVRVIRSESLDPNLTPTALTDEAKAIFDQSKSGFLDEFGTHVISEEHWGHHLQVQIEFRSTKSWDAQTLKARVEATYRSLSASGEVRFQNENEKRSFRDNVSITVRIDGRGLDGLPTFDAGFLDNPTSASQAYTQLKSAIASFKPEKAALIGLGFRKNPVIAADNAFKFPDFDQRDAQLKRLYASFRENKAVEMDARYRLRNTRGISKDDREFLAAVVEVFSKYTRRIGNDGSALLLIRPDPLTGNIRLPEMLTSDNLIIDTTLASVGSLKKRGLVLDAEPLAGGAATMPILLPRIVDLRWPLRPDDEVPARLEVGPSRLLATGGQHFPGSITDNGNSKPTDRGRYIVSIGVKQTASDEINIASDLHFGFGAGEVGRSAPANPKTIDLAPGSKRLQFTVRANAKVYGTQDGQSEGNARWEGRVDTQRNDFALEGPKLDSDVLRELCNRARNPNHNWSQNPWSKAAKALVDGSTVKGEAGAGSFSYVFETGSIGRLKGFEITLEFVELE